MTPEETPREQPEEPRENPAADPSPLAKKAVAGAFWSVATGVGSRVFSLAATLIVTRYVNPTIYGEVSVAVVVTQLASLGATLGVGQYISTRPSATRSELFHAALLFHVAGALALALVYLLREPLGPLFGAQHAEPYIAGFIAATLLERVALIPEAMLVRDMRFRTNGLISSASELLYSGVVLALAWRGLGGFAIVYAGVARSGLRAALVLWVTDRREWTTPHRLHRETALGVLRYGLPLTAARLSAVIARRGDNLAFGALFGPARMGAYNLAYNLADVPATTVGERIGDVLLPSFAKLPEKDRPAALVRSLSLLGFAVFPLAALLAGISRPLTLLLNDEWRALDVRWMLLLLAMLSISRPPEWALRVYLQVAARTRAIMLVEWTKVVVLMAAIFALGQLGPLAACVGVTGTFLGSALFYLFVAMRESPISFGRALSALALPFLCANVTLALTLAADRFVVTDLVAAMKPGTIGVALLDRYMLPQWSAAAGIALDLACGVAAYAVTTSLIARKQVRDIIHLLRRSRRSAAGQP